MRAVVFDNISVQENPRELSFAIEAGTMAAAITSRQGQNDCIVRLILGLERPDGGTLSVLGLDPSEADLMELRKRIGVLHSSGGLVSNLKVAENVALPLAFHGRLTERELELRVAEMLKRVGYQGRLMELPGNLSLYQRRLAGQARCFSLEPELVIYNAVLGGLGEEEQKRIITNAISYHGARPGRTALFLTSQPETMRRVPLDMRLDLEENAFP